MKNYLQHGDTVDAVAPAGGVVSGSPILIGSLFGVPATSAAEGESFALRRKGVFASVAKETGTAWTFGDTLYWDDTAKKFTKAIGTVNRRVGVAAADALDSAAIGNVILVPTAGITIAALGTVTTADNTKASIDAALATIVAKINAALAGVR